MDPFGSEFSRWYGVRLYIGRQVALISISELILFVHRFEKSNDSLTASESLVDSFLVQNVSAICHV